jgi:adenylate cyclase
MRFRTSSLFYPSLVVAFLAIVIAIRHADPFFIRGLRLMAFDSFLRLDPATFDPDLPVRIVDIDADSLAKFGQWPWPRTHLRDLSSKLSEAGAATVAFDFLFIEPDRTSPEEVLKRLPPQQAEALSPHVSDASNDKAFASALEAAPSVLATTLLDTATDPPEPKAGFVVLGDDPRPFLVAFPGNSRNLAVLDQAAHGIGAINWVPDRDQVVRRVSLMYRVQDQYVPAFAAETLRIAQGATTFVLKASNASGETAFGRQTGLNNIRVGDFEIPTDAEGAVFLKFRHSTRAAYIPAWKVLTGEVSQEEVSGKIILLGTSAAGLYDLRATPLDAVVPGVEIHAQLIEQMIRGQFLNRPDYALPLEHLAVVLLGLALALVLPRLSARSSTATGVLTILIVVAGGWLAFKYGNLLLDPSYPALALGALTAGITSYTYRQVEKQRGEIRGAFARYLAPAVVEELIANPEKLELGGQERELTLMFTDVRNFTSISEKLAPSELTQFINELLSPLSEIILANRGTIDKYMGDAIMAFWNAPLDDRDHAANACRAALQMIAKMEQLNADWRQRASLANRPFQRVDIGIGVNTGYACVGNLGSAVRFDYSAIGDEVNTASRMEGLCKVYGVSNVVGESTLTTARDLQVLELDMVQVKGRTRSSRIYSLLAPLNLGQAELRRLSEAHQGFLTAYRQQHWDDAQRQVGECRAVGIPALESYYQTMLSRIGSLQKATLLPDWDGSFALTEK